MEDKTEMQWVSNWCKMSGTSANTLVLSTWNNVNSGCWSDATESSNYRYICEKNE